MTTETPVVPEVPVEAPVNPVRPDMFGEGVKAYAYTGKLTAQALNAAVCAKLEPGSSLYHTNIDGVEYIGVPAAITITGLALVK